MPGLKLDHVSKLVLDGITNPSHKFKLGSFNRRGSLGTMSDDIPKHLGYNYVQILFSD